MSLALTVLDEFRLTWDNHQLDAYENRFNEFGAAYTFLADTDVSVPGADALVEERKTADRTVSVVVGQSFSPTVRTKRKCAPTVDAMTTNYQTPVWAVLETGFSMAEAVNEGNYVSYLQQFSRQIEGVQKALLGALDTACVSHLAANASVVNNAAGNPFAFTGNAIQVAKASHADFFNEYGSIAMSNGLPSSGYNVIGSPRTMAIVRSYQNQGSGNSTNYAYQFAGYKFAYSNNISVATGQTAVLYVAPVGSLALLTWIDPDCRIGKQIGNHKVWSKIFLPRLGREVGLYYSADCDTIGSTQTFARVHKETFEFSIDYAVMSGYNSAPSTSPGVIFEANLLKA